MVAREAEGQQRRARAEQTAAASLWSAPPAFELSHRDDRFHDAAGRRETELGLAWPLWLPGQRAARGAAADAELSLAELAQRAARLRVAGDVREAAWTLVGQRADVAQAQTQVRSLTAVANDVERRVRAGDLARADALAARAELLSARAAETQARQRLEGLRSQWAVLTGRSADPDATEPDADTTSRAPAEHPAVALASEAAELARRRADAVRASRRDAPELLLRYWQEAPGGNVARQGSIGVGVRVPFGTDGRNQPLQAAALAELDVAQATEQRTRERQSAELAVARAAVQSTEQQLMAERESASLLRERAQLIDRSFRAGETSLPELLRALAGAAQADAARERQQAALGLARARLQQALGVLP